MEMQLGAVDHPSVMPFVRRASERIGVIRRLEHRGSTHFVVDHPDGTRGLLPAWMAEPWAAQLATVEVPRLALEALHTLRRVIDSALLSLRVRRQ